MIRKKKKFAWPKKLYDKPRIDHENTLVEKYGLKNKKEIWKAEAKVKYFRNRAKFLITASEEEKQIFFAKLNKIGLKVNSIADVLALNKEDLLKRRLAFVLFEKKISTSPQGARQMITHRRVTVKGRVVNAPNYLVNISEEPQIALVNIAHKKKKSEEVKSEDVTQ